MIWAAATAQQPLLSVLTAAQLSIRDSVLVIRTGTIIGQTANVSGLNERTHVLTRFAQSVASSPQA
jgi:hypothetical protein